jgi:hypothetical protein
MNSLPLISHRLFVAAIGNEGRVHDKPKRQERPPVDLAGRGPAIALEVVAGARVICSDGTRPSRASATQPQA